MDLYTLNLCNSYQGNNPIAVTVNKIKPQHALRANGTDQILYHRNFTQEHWMIANLIFFCSLRLKRFYRTISLETFSGFAFSQSRLPAHEKVSAIIV